MKKLIPAICMTLIAAFMLASSTFAWFSMNTTVKATGMEIKANAESKFLQIVAGDDAFSDTTAQTSATAKTASKDTLRPTKPVAGIEADELSYTALTNSNTSANIIWVEAFSSDPSLSTAATKYNNVTTLANKTDTSNVYTLLNTFKVRMNPTTGVDEGTNLSVSKVTITAGTQNQLLPAVRVLIVCGDNWIIFKHNGSDATEVELTNTTTNIIALTVGTTATNISVYVYFDGADGAATTNNANLSTDGYKVDFELSIA